MAYKFSTVFAASKHLTAAAALAAAKGRAATHLEGRDDLIPRPVKNVHSLQKYGHSRRMLQLIFKADAPADYDGMHI